MSRMISCLKNLKKYIAQGGVVYTPIRFVKADERFVDKVVLIIGGSTGIGFEAVREFISEGAKVIITASREELLKEATEKIKSDNLKYIVWDISDVTCFNAKLQEAVSLFGGIDIFVNNAGVFKCDRWDQFDENTYDSMLDTNTKGLFFMCQAEGKYLVGAKKRGKILNVCSSFGVDARFDPYSVSKWGSVCITKGLAKELVKHRVVVNGVAPGSIPTNITGGNTGEVNENAFTPEHLTNKRVLTEEVASLLLFLASDSANSIIGQVIAVDNRSSLH